MLKSRKKKKSPARLQKISLVLWLSILLSVVVLCLVGFWGYSFYQMQQTPVIENRADMTTLPAEIAQVLGATTGPSERPSQSLRVPILMYHYIEYVADPNDKIRISLNTPPSVFEKQLQTLSQGGYTFITATDLTNSLSGKMKLPAKPVVLTFDDGYRDFYTDAYPLLKKYHAKAVQYVIVDFLDHPNHLLKSQLEEIARDGLVEIGSHTMHHVWLRGASAKNAQYEITESKKQLQNQLHLPISSFAYPSGAFDFQAIAFVKDAGYTNAMSTVAGSWQSEDDQYFFYRLRPGWRVGQELLRYLTQQR